VVLAEDQPLVVAGLTSSLESAGDIAVVGHTTDAAGTRAVLAERDVDVVLVDLHLPGLTAGEILLDRRREPGWPAILVLSAFDSSACLSAAMHMGAAGFVLTTWPVHAIVRAIRSLQSGAVAFTAAQVREASRAGWTPLSLRDYQIVDGLVRGRSNDELASDLGISRKTVEHHLGRLFERFSVLNRVELAVRVERERLLTLPVTVPGSDRGRAMALPSRRR
jgi:DNA-binding NarL/FixJ family response regulator